MSQSNRVNEIKSRKIVQLRKHKRHENENKSHRTIQTTLDSKNME